MDTRITGLVGESPVARTCSLQATYQPTDWLTGWPTDGWMFDSDEAHELALVWRGK